MSRIFGRLSVSTDAVTFQPEGPANALSVEPVRRIVHRDHLLTIVVGRLVLPWMNSGLVLVDSDPLAPSVGVVLLSAGQRRAVVAAARTAGFDVSVHRTWLSAGGGIGSVAELERFRREHG